MLALRPGDMLMCVEASYVRRAGTSAVWDRRIVPGMIATVLSAPRSSCKTLGELWLDSDPNTLCVFLLLSNGSIVVEFSRICGVLSDMITRWKRVSPHASRC